MTFLWIPISTRWDLSSVQATLNVMISVLSTVGLWAFTRYWWRRGTIKVLRDKASVPLSTLLTVAGPGDGWDVMAVLKRQVFAKDHWHLLIQLIVVVTVSLSCAFAGPIAKASLRDGLTIHKKDLQVLEAVKGGGAFGNMLFANVLWNDTDQSLKDANFPDNQLLDYLPPVTEPPWTYVADEWDPTWALTCNYTERTPLPNLNGSGQGNMFHPLDAFPAFRDTYEPFWLNSSKYRIITDFNTWENWSDPIQFTDAFFYVLAQSDPEYGDQMLHNNETLRLSISVLHVHKFQVLYEIKNSVLGDETWRPIGPVGDASYTRAECNITRTNQVADPDHMPWPWTNDTDSIVTAYRTYYNVPFAYKSSKKVPLAPQPATEILRFYQVYMASINTFQGNQVLRSISLGVRTVELSVIFLIVLIILALLTVYSSIRYGMFLKRYSTKIKEMYIPDSKIEWMIHAVKSSESGVDLEANNQTKNIRESERLRSATFGHIDTDAPKTNEDLQIPKLARVMTSPSTEFPSRSQSRFSFSRSRAPTISRAASLAPDQGNAISLSSSARASSRTLVPVGSEHRVPSAVDEQRQRSSSRLDVSRQFLTVDSIQPAGSSGRSTPVTVDSSSR